MPYCERGSAAKLAGKISEEEAWKFLHDVASGLAYLHDQEPPVIHQDIKPDNVLINARGQYLITDFGVSARVRNTLRKSVGVQTSGGTIAYMSPERFGKDNTPIMASDVWALGATLYELLTGDVPFGDNGGLIQKSGAEIPGIKGSYSSELCRITERCLSLDPWDRPLAKTIVEWTEQHARGEKIKDKPITPPSPQPQPTPKPEPKPIHPPSSHGKGVLWSVFGGIVALILIVFIAIQVQEPKVAVEDAAEPVYETTAPAEEWDSSSASEATEQQRHEQLSQAQRDQEIRDGIAKEQAKYDIPMVYVAGGTFTMGCTYEQGDDCFDDEKPAHEVTLSDFYIGKYEVTQAQWKAVMETNPSRFSGCDNCPVEKISWNDVQKFIRKLNQKTGKTYRLPTEAEWEYAARGGKGSKGYKYSGSNNAGEVAWYDRSRTHPVGQKRANELVIYDMSGNVLEWCQDWYGSYSSSSQTNPKGPSSGSYRVIRGGSWGHYARGVRVSFRFYITPDIRISNLGFRLARSSK
jgi:formylglycine-generating enzyme required for sulfatase activity